MVSTEYLSVVSSIELLKSTNSSCTSTLLPNSKSVGYLIIFLINLSLKQRKYKYVNRLSTHNTIYDTNSPRQENLNRASLFCLLFH